MFNMFDPICRPNMFTDRAILDIITAYFDNVEYKCMTGLILLDLIKAFDAFSIIYYRVNFIVMT